MHAFALSNLEKHLRPGNSVLDVGSGSGYLTACMAKMVTPGGRATGIDHIPELVQKAKNNIVNGKTSVWRICIVLLMSCAFWHNFGFNLAYTTKNVSAVIYIEALQTPSLYLFSLHSVYFLLSMAIKKLVIKITLNDFFYDNFIA